MERGAGFGWENYDKLHSQTKSNETKFQLDATREGK